MAYLPPAFNLIANIWRAGGGPPAAPDVVSPAQLYYHSRADLPLDHADLTKWIPPVFLRVPAGTDLRTGDVVEVNNGDNWLYKVRWTERVHRGFPNEYFTGMMSQTTVPVPGGPTLLGHAQQGTFGGAATVFSFGIPGPPAACLAIVSIAFDGGANSVVTIDIDGTPFTLATGLLFNVGPGLSTAIFYAPIGAFVGGLFNCTMVQGCRIQIELSYVQGVTGPDVGPFANSNFGSSIAPSVTTGGPNASASTFTQAMCACVLPDPPLSYDPPVTNEDVAIPSDSPLAARAGYQIATGIITSNFSMSGIAPAFWVGSVAVFA